MIETGIPGAAISRRAELDYNFPANSYPPEQPLMFQLPNSSPRATIGCAVNSSLAFPRLAAFGSAPLLIIES